MAKNSVENWISVTLSSYSWAPILVFGIHIISVTLFRIYKYWPEFDTPMHIAGGLSVAYFLTGAYHLAKSQNLIGNPTNIIKYLIVFFATSTVTILWEFAEFFSDRYLATRVQGGTGETLLDMAFGMLGAIIALYITRKNK